MQNTRCVHDNILSAVTSPLAPAGHQTLATTQKRLLVFMYMLHACMTHCCCGYSCYYDKPHCAPVLLFAVFCAPLLCLTMGHIAVVFAAALVYTHASQLVASDSPTQNFCRLPCSEFCCDTITMTAAIWLKYCHDMCMLQHISHVSKPKVLCRIILHKADSLPTKLQLINYPVRTQDTAF